MDKSRHAIKIVKNRKLHFGMAKTEVKILKMILEKDPTDSANIGMLLNLFNDKFDFEALLRIAAISVSSMKSSLKTCMNYFTLRNSVEFRCSW